MSAVLIEESLIRKILQIVCGGLAVSRDGNNLEVSGLLLGRESQDKLLITSAVTGEQSSSEIRSDLSEDFMATVANNLIGSERKERIVGMFHSHPGIGIFISQRDARTMMNFQRLYHQFVMMVVDPLVPLSQTRYKFFRCETSTGRVIQVQWLVARFKGLGTEKTSSLKGSSWN